MATQPAHPTGPRYLDPIIGQRVQPTTVRKYRKALLPFLSFTTEHRHWPETSGEFDDLLCEWRHSRSINKAAFESTVAAVEFALPRFRGQLPWCRALIHSWAIVHVPQHKVPMGEGPAVYIGVHIAARGHPRLGAGLVIQQAVGLRPSELLGLWGRDVVLPEDRADAAAVDFAVLGLGIRSGTKAKRPQSVILRGSKKVALVRWLRSTCVSDEPLIGYSYEQMRRLLARTVSELGLAEIGWSAHSPRAGFASDLVSKGVPILTIKDLGRWVSEASARTYIDVTASSSILVTFRTRHLTAARAYACQHLLTFFNDAVQFERLPASPACVLRGHAAKGLEVQPDHHAVRSADRGHSFVDGTFSVSVHEIDEFPVAERGSGGDAAATPVGTARGRGQCRGRGQGQGDRQVAQGRGRGRSRLSQRR